MKSTYLKRFALLALAAAVVFACSKPEEEEPAPVNTDPTLYERVGGTTKVADPNNAGAMIEQGRLSLRSVVDSTILIIAADERLQPYFTTLLAEVGSGDLSGFAVLSENLTDFFCVATGSENPDHAYSGLNMKDAHDPAVNGRMDFKANTASFDAFLGDLVAGLAKNGVTDSELVGDLGALVNTLKGDVVQTAEDPPTNDPDPTIYEEVGGTTMVSDPTNPGTMIEQGRLSLRSVVDSTIFVIAADVKLQPYFATLLAEVGGGDLSGFSVLSENLTDFFCVATGSENPNYAYVGLDMRAAHDPSVNARMAFAANDEAFDQFIADVVIGANQNGVTDAGLIGRIGALIETLRADVVQTTDGPPTIYQRVGGTTMVSDPNNPGSMIEQGRLSLRSVVDSTIFVIAGDPVLQPYFTTLLTEVGSGDLSGFVALSEGLTDFFCVATGSENPAHAYTGLNMVDAHNPSVNGRMSLAADNAAFDQFIVDVVAGANQNGVTDPLLLGDIGALLETLRGDVVQR